MVVAGLATGPAVCMFCDRRKGGRPGAAAGVEGVPRLVDLAKLRAEQELCCVSAVHAVEPRRQRSVGCAGTRPLHGSSLAGRPRQPRPRT
eukprot:scaffold20911_cov69-Phaeocystis_antarctica.AAC.3